MRRVINRNSCMEVIEIAGDPEDEATKKLVRINIRG